MTENYGVSFVEGDVLPEGRDFALVVTTDGVQALLRKSAICPELLEDSWAAWRALSEPRRAPSRLSVASAS